MAAAVELLGAELYCGGIPDGSLTDDRPTRQLLIEILRRFRPSLVLAHCPTDYHADHRAASAAAEAATWLSASAGQKTKSPRLSVPPALWWMDTVTMQGFDPGFYIDVSAFLPLKEAMLTCHRSQMARSADEGFSPLLDLLRLQARARGEQAGVAAAECFRAHHAFKRSRAW
jgi:LmbE family N-acetylglucosaminyl deacetylase